VTGVTTGQTALPTATDSDDTEVFLAVGLTAALQALANLFESATGHDHSGAGKGKPIVTAGIASGVTLTSPSIAGATLTGTTSGAIMTLSGLLTANGGLTVATGSSNLQTGLTVSGGTTVVAALSASGNLTHTGANLGFFSAPVVSQQGVGAASTDLASVITLANNIRSALRNYGLSS
jgi:hypothetical protein